MIFLIISVIVCFVHASMVAAEKSKIFNSWDDVINASYSAFFFAEASDIQLPGKYANNHPWLSEELLFVQSNTRMLVCQNPNGEFRYAAIPTQVYPVPTNHGIPNGPGYGPGMYYHFDAAKIANLSYSFKPSDKEAAVKLVSPGVQNKSWYARHFLPVTKSRQNDLEATFISFAPFTPEKGNQNIIPAPPGALFLLYLKNTGQTQVRGEIRLECPDKLHSRKPETSINRNTLILSLPEASAGIHMVGGSWEEVDDRYYAAKEIILEPGQSILIQSYVVLGENYKDIMPVIYQFYKHDALDWLNFTANFWEERLGSLKVSSNKFPKEAEISRDIYYRCIIDNFCCLQTDSKGNLVAHYQGVPKEGTIWGIDYEPTIISAMHVAPELGRPGIRFATERNYAPVSEYGTEHSVPILISPLIIARKYLELTGDVAYFKDNPDIMELLEHTIRDLLALKSPHFTLFPSRFSSDGTVGRRYDHGTNVKAFYALDSWGYILDAIGKKKDALYYRKLAKEVSRDIDQTMVVNGPFGRQISGGANLGEPPGDFYLPDSVIYYDGEDTGSHLAMIYGVYGWDYQPWINYHRWARSMFCPSYEPEFGTLRWFPSWSMPVLDGTGWVSVLGGSITTSEMARSLTQLYRICDPTGSFYWWPIAYNFKQGLSRCSQGQGTWAWQYLEQWLGVKTDALNHTLTIAPRGLPDKVLWENFSCGNQHFDIFLEEGSTGTNFKVTNQNPVAWTVRLGCRPSGAGIQGPIVWQTIKLQPGQTRSLIVQNSSADPPETDIVTLAEIEQFADENGIMFMRYGPVDQFPKWYHLYEEEFLDVRFYLLNGTNTGWEHVSITLKYPEGWKAKHRKPGYWEEPDGLLETEAVFDMGSIAAMESAVAPFIVRGPHDYDLDYLTAGKSRHFPAECGPGISLPANDIELELKTSMEAILRINLPDGSKMEKTLIVPVTLIPVTNYKVPKNK